VTSAADVTLETPEEMSRVAVPGEDANCANCGSPLMRCLTWHQCGSPFQGYVHEDGSHYCGRFR
jgi:hypothetical protein